ncbi:MAG: LpqB family beta-propeller domain-containing protein [Propioniciclava sp.]|uniref:GerMN domain-containing protein n=1 Tax=Propioniciclava sp. TaxID=2038686 RepID=UPI0039E2C994
MTGRLVSLLLVLAVALTGCVSVPTSGPIVRVSAVAERVNTGVEIAPGPPQQGAGAGTIVDGFLHAMASYQPDYAVARAYLTAEATARWHPEQGVRIYAEGNPVSIGEGKATLKASVVGTIDAAGAYRQSNDVVDHDFGLVRDADGQWRISNPPEGLLVSEYLFPSAFTRVVTYFPANDGDWLVPDPRYFPRGEQAHQRAAAAVAGGATQWLAPAVAAAPERLALDGVSVDAAGVATIALRRGAADLDATARARLAKQFAWTFRQFETVAAIQVGWAGEPAWEVAPHGKTIPTSAFAEADPVDRSSSRQLFGIHRGRIVRVGEGAAPVTHIEVAPGIADAAVAAVRPDAVAAASASADGRHLNLAPLSEPGGQSLEPPGAVRRLAFSRQGELWAVLGGALFRLGPGSSWGAVPAAVPRGAQVERFRLSPDGARIALVIRTPGGNLEMGVARVVRTGDRVAVEGWRSIDVSRGSVAPLTVLDAGWRTPDTLLAVVSDGRTTQVFAVAQDGSNVTPIGPSALAGLTELAVAPGVPPVVRTADGEVWRYSSDFRWTAQASELSSVFYPG